MFDSKGNNFIVNSLTRFDKMITPTLIQILFWIGILQAFGLALLVIIAGFGAAAAAANEHSALRHAFHPAGASSAASWSSSSAFS